ncbi:MAG: thiolase family protein [Acidimicrobiales bacterium]
MGTAVVVDVVRTALGRRNGKLAGWHPVDLAAALLDALVERNGIDPALVDDVILGCVSQTGEQGLNVARNAALAAGFPDSVPGTTVDRQCGSGQQAVHFAAQGVAAGAYDLVVAGGVESMSRVPLGTTMVKGPGVPFGPRMVQRYQPAGGLVPQGVAAEALAERYGLSRPELDAYSRRSHVRAAAATAAGSFDGEIVPVTVDHRRAKRQFTVDESIRAGTTLEELAALKPTFRAGGCITAGNSAPASDGAAAVLVASEEAAARLGLVPRARFVAFSVVGVDPVTMLTGAAAATTAVLERAGLELDRIDRAEVHEAFAAVALAWAAEHPLDPDRVNADGGAIALGHPLGCSGARMLATLVGGLERNGGRYGLQAMAEGGGTANALVVERLG